MRSKSLAARTRRQQPIIACTCSCASLVFVATLTHSHSLTSRHYRNSELLVPIVTYVTIRSKIRTLYSQMMFIEDATTEGNGAMGISLFGKEDFIKNTWEMAVEDLLARCVSNAFVATSDDSSDDEQPLDDSEGDSDVKAPADTSTRPVSALSLSLELDRRQRAPQ